MNMKIKKLIGKASPPKKLQSKVSASQFCGEVNYDFTQMMKPEYEMERREEQASILEETAVKFNEERRILFSDSFRESFHDPYDGVESNSSDIHDEHAEDGAITQELAIAPADFHKILKSILDKSNGKMTPKCADTLCQMGDMYLKRSQEVVSLESEKNARRAKASFMVASKIYDLYSMKVETASALKNLEKARELEYAFKRSVNSQSVSQSCSTETFVDEDDLSMPSSFTSRKNANEKSDTFCSMWYILFRCCDAKYIDTNDDFNRSISDDDGIECRKILDSFSNDS